MVFLPLVGSVAASSYAAVPTGAAGALTLPGSFAYYLVVGWMAGAVLGILHVGYGLYRLRRLRATGTPVAAEQVDPILWRSLCEIQSRRSVTLCVSDAVRVPAAIGYFRPMVVFPSWALAEIPTQELNAILLHELAHLRRYDDWTNLAQKLGKAVLFFHPAVWFIESRLTLEREMACDDAVLTASYSPRAYAESLVSLAEKSFLRRGTHLAQAAVSHVQQLKLRLAEILRRDRAVSGQGGAHQANSAIAAMSLAAIVAVWGSSIAPQVVEFRSVTPLVASASTNSRPVSAANERGLQPVNLNYVDWHPQATPASRKASLSQHGPQRCTVTQPSVVVAKPERERTVTDEVVPPIVQASSNPPMEPTATPLLVVFQGEQFSVDGPVFWRVTIVHLTPAQQRAIKGEISKQI